MYERSYQDACEQQRPGAIMGASLGASTREVPMAESMNRLMNIITMFDEAITELDQRTHVIRQTGPANAIKEGRPERTYSPLVGSLNDQISRLERLNYTLRQITSELEI